MNAFEKRKTTSQYWFNSSSDLHASAAALWLSTDESISARIVQECNLGTGFRMDAAVGPVFLMLCGMSMELIFKAITVELGKPINVSGHNLLVNVSTTGVSYTTNELKLLEVLSHEITWAGRYPTPKNEHQLEEYNKLVRENLFERVPFGAGTALRPNDALNWDSFNGLWSKAVQEYFRIKES